MPQDIHLFLGRLHAFGIFVSKASLVQECGSLAHLVYLDVAKVVVSELPDDLADVDLPELLLSFLSILRVFVGPWHPLTAYLVLIKVMCRTTSFSRRLFASPDFSSASATLLATVCKLKDKLSDS